MFWHGSEGAAKFYQCLHPLPFEAEGVPAPFNRMEPAEGRALGFAFGRGVAGEDEDTPIPAPASEGLAPTPDAGTEGAREVAPVAEPLIPILEAFRRCKLLIGNLVLEGRLVAIREFPRCIRVAPTNRLERALRRSKLPEVGERTGRSSRLGLVGRKLHKLTKKWL